jgi:hypothetical protein
MKVRTAIEILTGLAELDGYLNGSGDRRTPYKFDGPTRLTIARARRQLRQAQEDYVEARNAALVELTDGIGELPPMTGPFESAAERGTIRAKHMAFAVKDRELLNAELTLELGAIGVAELKLEDNPIPPSVLDMLGPMLEDG